MKEQVLSIEQMQVLIDLGIDVSKANAYYALCAGGDYKLYFRDKYIDCDNCTPTFTLQDILEMLPSYQIWDSKKYGYKCGINSLQCIDADGHLYTEYGTTPLEAAFNMLKWCKQNNYI